MSIEWCNICWLLQIIVLIVCAEHLIVRKKNGFQILIALAANCGTINTGLVFGYTAVSLPQLKMATSRVLINRNQASWIGKSCMHTLVYVFRTKCVEIYIYVDRKFAQYIFSNCSPLLYLCTLSTFHKFGHKLILKITSMPMGSYTERRTNGFRTL